MRKRQNPVKVGTRAQRAARWRNYTLFRLRSIQGQLKRIHDEGLIPMDTAMEAVADAIAVMSTV